MANLSQKKREEMLCFLETLRREHTDDKSTRAIAEIENMLNEKKYGLVWEKHKEQVDDDLEEKIPLFTEIEEKRINKDTSENYNFLIEGDNLHSLYLLDKTHKESIDCIYIDPPYNTGNNDFIYNDCYVGKEDSYRHSKWLSFMSRRMEIAYRLLSPKGVMFISIDEHEIAQLMMLSQELFGNNNVDYMIWQKTDSKVDRNTNAKVINRVKDIHEAIIVCYKDKNNTRFNKMMRLPEWKHKQENRDNDPRGPWASGIMSYEEGHDKEDKNSEYYYTITTPSGKEYTRHWHVLKNVFEKLNADNRIHYPRNGEGVPRIKTFENEEKDFYMETILRGVGTSSSAKDELLGIFGDRDIFDTPKPTKLIKELIRVATNKESIVLDFFAGSGTTAQAVLELNEEDKGNRKFIVCTTNEVEEMYEIKYLEQNHYIDLIDRTKTGKVSKKSKSYSKYKEFLETNKYKKAIAKDSYKELGISRRITYERIKAVINGKEDLEYPNGVKCNLKYYVTDWTSRKPEDYLLSNALCLHVKEMIELQKGVSIDNKKRILILNKADYYKYILEGDIDEIEDVWVNQNILFNSEEIKVLNKTGFKKIPEEFFGFELKEVAE